MNSKSNPLFLNLCLSLSISVALCPVSTVLAQENTPTNTQNQPNYIRELPILPELSKTPQTMEKEVQVEEVAQKLFDEAQIVKSLSKWQEAYAMALDMKYSDGQGRSLTGMCKIYVARGQFIKAKELGENAAELLMGSGDHKSLGQAQIALAQAYFGLDDNYNGGLQLQAAFKSFQDTGSTDAQQAAVVMNLAGGVLMKSGKIKEAFTFYQGAANYYGQLGEYSKEIETRTALAGMMEELGWLVAAQEEAGKAVTEARASKDPSLLVAALTSLGSTQYNLGEFSNALKSYDEALQQPSVKLVAGSIANLEAGYGHCLIATGNPESAKKYLNQALSSLKPLGSVVSEAEVLNVLGCLEESQGHHNKALQLLSQALDFQSIASPRQDKLGAVVLQNLAVVESRLGDNRAAKDHLESALVILKRYKNPLLQGRVFSSLAEVGLYQKDLALTEKCLTDSITVSEPIGDDAVLWRDYTLLAYIQSEHQQPQQAHDSLMSALSHFRSPQAGCFIAPECLYYPTSRQDMGVKLVSYLVSNNMIDQALIAAEQLKEESFVNKWGCLGGEVKREDRDIYNDLFVQKAHLHAAELQTTPIKVMDDWKNWLTRFQQLSKDNPTLARLIAPAPLNMSQIEKALQDHNSPIIDYLIGDNSSIVFTIVDKNKLSAVTLPVGRLQLEQPVSALLNAAQKASSGSQDTERRSLKLLFEELLPPSVFAMLPSDNTQPVIVIPDGILFDLPFSALIDNNGKYLVENHTVVIAPSLGAFLDSPPRYTSGISVVVASNSQSTNQDAEAVSNLLGSDAVTKLTGGEADLSDLQDQAHGKAVLHFSDDLSLSDSNPLKTALPLFVNKDSKTPAIASELFGSSLNNDLALWSSTTINSKDTDGTAVRLFSRGLNYAGIRNVLMSLWCEPASERTPEIVDFYKGSQKGLNNVQALRQAELLALSKDPAPHSWAAFELLGPGF